MRTLGFEKYAENLEIYLKKFRDVYCSISYKIFQQVLKANEKLGAAAGGAQPGKEGEGKEKGEEEEEEEEDEEEEADEPEEDSKEAAGGKE